MKFVTEKSDLQSALSHAYRIVERRNTIPILSNVKIVAETDQIILTSTDQRSELVETLPAKVTSTGSTTVDAAMLQSIVRKAPANASIEVSLEQESLHLAAGRASFVLPTVSAEGFPNLTPEEYQCSYSLTPDEIIRLIKSTSFAISQDETRYYLNGILLEHTTGTAGLRAVATDGHRLALSTIENSEISETHPRIIIPTKAVLEIERLASETGETVKVQVSDRTISFTFQNIVLTSNLIDGNFPDYQAVIPTEGEAFAVVDVLSLGDAVDRVQTIASDRVKAVKFLFQSDKVSLSVNNAEQGHADEDVELTYTGEELKIGFNAKYLMDILEHCNSETMHIYLSSSQAPALLRSPSEVTPLFVLMPMRV